MGTKSRFIESSSSRGWNCAAEPSYLVKMRASTTLTRRLDTLRLIQLTQCLWLVPVSHLVLVYLMTLIEATPLAHKLWLGKSRSRTLLRISIGNPRSSLSSNCATGIGRNEGPIMHTERPFRTSLTVGDEEKVDNHFRVQFESCPL